MRLCAILSIIALALMPLSVAADATIVARVGKYGERTKDAVQAWLGTLGSAGDHNFGQAVCAIKSHAVLLGFAETDISKESTRQLSSLLKAADDAVGHPSGRERVRKTRNTWTITPPAGTSALGKQAASQVVASNHQVLDKRTVESRKERAVQANAAIELLESKNATLVANLEDAARREAMLLTQLAEARGTSLLSSSSSSSSLPAASLAHPQASHTHTAPTSIHTAASSGAVARTASGAHATASAELGPAELGPAELGPAELGPGAGSPRPSVAPKSARPLPAATRQGGDERGSPAHGNAHASTTRRRRWGRRCCCCCC